MGYPRWFGHKFCCCLVTRSTIATSAVTLSGIVLMPQLLYGGKTRQNLPKYELASSFSLSVTPTHNSNMTEAIQFLDEIISPYLEQKHEEPVLPND